MFATAEFGGKGGKVFVSLVASGSGGLPISSGTPATSTNSPFSLKKWISQPATNCWYVFAMKSRFTRSYSITTAETCSRSFGPPKR